MEELEYEIQKQKNLLVVIYDKPIFRKFNLLLRPLLVLSLFFLAGLILFGNRLCKINWSNIELIVGLICAGIWLYLGQILIYNHYHKIYKKFWKKLYDLVDNKSEVLNVNFQISQKCKKFSDVILVIWLIIIIMALIFGADKLSIVGIRGLSDSFFCVFVILCVFAGYLTSVGLTQTLKMVYSIGYISKKLKIPFDQLNEDGIGNYSVIAKYCLPTTMYLTSGVFFVPILVVFMKSGNTSTNWLTLLLILMFSMFILLSMVYPLIKGYLMANESKSVVMMEIKEQMFSSINQCIEEPIEANKIQWETLNHKYKLIETIPTYPFQLNIVIKIVVTTLIPIFTFFLQMFLTQDVILDFIKRFI